MRYSNKYSFYLIFLLYLLLSYRSPKFGGESQTEEGLFQFGHSKDHRPDLPQIKVMQAVLDPLGRPLATDVISGERADDQLYVPCMCVFRQAWVGMVCCRSVIVKWWYARRGVSLQARMIIICVRCLYCNWLRESGDVY